MRGRHHRAGRRSHGPLLCRRGAPPRNGDPSLFWLLRSPAPRTVPGIDVAAPHVNAHRAESFGSGRGLLANRPADCARRSPPRNTPVRGHTDGTRRFAARSADSRTPEPLPAPPTRPPTGRWTAPGRAGIKALLNGSPTSNRNGRGPGVDGQIVPGPSLILIEVDPRRPRRRARTSNDHREYLGDSRRYLTRTRQKFRHEQPSSWRRRHLRITRENQSGLFLASQIGLILKSASVSMR